MFKPLFAISAVALGAVSLSGCGAISVATTAAEFEEAYSRVDSMATTSNGSMPTSGSATYTGNTVIGAGSGNDNYILLGDAELQANFTNAGGTVTGNMDNFSRIKLTDAQVTAFNNGSLSTNQVVAAAANASGDVDITNGVITGTGFRAQTDGQVTSKGTTFDISGRIDGEFKGNGASAVQAVAGNSFDVKVDGASATDVELELVAE